MNPRRILAVPVSPFRASGAEHRVSIRVRRLLLVVMGGPAFACGNVVDTVALSYRVEDGVAGAKSLVDAAGNAASSAAADAATGGAAGAGASLSDAEAGASSTPGAAGSSPACDAAPLCSSTFRRDRFEQALCSCGDLRTLSSFVTLAFDSEGLPMPAGGAAVGVNGACLSPTGALIGGSLTVASAAPLPLAALNVDGDLRLAGELRVAGPLTVTRDAWFAASAQTLSVASIGRNVHAASGATLDNHILSGTLGQRLVEDFDVPAPCRCQGPETLDWIGAIAEAARTNDNASVRLVGSQLSQLSEPANLTLPCGRFYLESVTGAADVYLKVEGRAALFVAGDVATSGALRVELADGAELDWFVGGRLDLSTAQQVGDPLRPAALRVYVAGQGKLGVPKAAFSGNLYAPQADVTLDGTAVDFYGSVFARSIESAAAVAVHYDVAVQRLADACRPPEPQVCTGCGECGQGRACVAGKCGGCVADADCCWPAVCHQGLCGAWKHEL